MTSDETRLHAILIVVDSHVRFGEAKNAAIVAASGALGVAVLSEFLSPDPLWIVTYVYLLTVLAGATASVILGIVSFLPQTRLPWLGELSPPSLQDNLLFFGQSQNYDAEGYWRALNPSRAGATVPALEFMYCEQIVINARIASRKFELFKYAAWALIYGILTPIGAYILHRYVRDPDLGWTPDEVK